VPGEPRPEDPKPTTSSINPAFIGAIEEYRLMICERDTRITRLEECLQLCRAEIIRSAGDTVWITHHETLVDYIGVVLADDTQGELFTKNKDQD
jgi:hypothetical protein